MKPGEFISKLDEQRIINAVAEAEKKTSGEIRVYISHKERHDALAFARKRFEQLRMTKTKHRNAVLIYLVPRTQQFAVIGDAGIHARCGDGFWTDIVARMTERLKAGEFTEAIIHAINETGAALAKYFPPEGENPDELPNEIVRD